MSFLARLFPSRLLNGERFAAELKPLLGYRPKNTELYKLAFRHSSASKKTAKTDKNNERLEFLGDAILSAVIADYLYRHYPNKSEGFLTSMRSKVVSRTNLNAVAEELSLQNFIVSKINNHKRAKSLGGDALEALIGAIYLDKGIKYAANFIHMHVLSEKRAFDQMENHVISYKGLLIEWAQKQRKQIEFTLLDDWGKQHNKTFKMGLKLNDQLISTGRGKSKKVAEEEASKKAFEQLNIA
jgi:ribonuclease-3